MHPSLNLDEVALARFCEAHRIRRLALLGSQLKGAARPDSDIDQHNRHTHRTGPLKVDRQRVAKQIFLSFRESDAELE